MKKIYLQIWNLAEPFYKKGRKMDVKHVKWMLKQGLEICKKEKLDESVFIPAIILHDVGYFKFGKEDSYKKSIRKKHMKEGVKIAQKILEKAKYDSIKTKKIVYYVSVHDNWALGDFSVYKDKNLAVLKDLDFLWMLAGKEMEKLLGKSREELIKDMKKEIKKRKFAVKSTEKLYKKLIENLK